MPSAPTAPKYDVDFTSALNSYKYEGETIPTKAAGESNKFDFLESVCISSFTLHQLTFPSV